jgi:hypothetical protein
MNRLGRLGASLGVLSVLAHGPLVYAGLRDGNLAVLGVALAMAAVCLPCAVHLWRGPTRVTWCVTAGMTAVMLALHGSLTAVMHHNHGGVPYDRVPAVALLTLCAAALLTSPRTARPNSDWVLTRR